MSSNVSGRGPEGYGWRMIGARTVFIGDRHRFEVVWEDILELDIFGEDLDGDLGFLFFFFSLSIFDLSSGDIRSRIARFERFLACAGVKSLI